MNKMLDKKGSTFLEVIVIIIIVVATLIILNHFQIIIATNKKNIENYRIFDTAVNNEIVEIYNEANWENLVNKEIKTRLGNITFSITDNSITEYNTHKINVDFKAKSHKRSYTLERSIYHE